MIDEEVIQTSDPVIDLPPDIDPQPDPDPVDPSVEVVPVDEFLDRLAELFGDREEDPEEAEGLEGAIQPIDGGVDLPVVDLDPVLTAIEIVGGRLIDMIGNLDRIEEHLGEIEKDTNEIQLDVMTIAQALDHPALTTSFADYTVTEALLLLLLLFAFISACTRMLRGGLLWLRS